MKRIRCCAAFLPLLTLIGILLAGLFIKTITAECVTLEGKTSVWLTKEEIEQSMKEKTIFSTETIPSISPESEKIIDLRDILTMESIIEWTTEDDGDIFYDTSKQVEVEVMEFDEIPGIKIERNLPPITIIPTPDAFPYAYESRKNALGNCKDKIRKEIEMAVYIGQFKCTIVNHDCVNDDMKEYLRDMGYTVSIRLSICVVASECFPSYEINWESKELNT